MCFLYSIILSLLDEIGIIITIILILQMRKLWLKNVNFSKVTINSWLLQDLSPGMSDSKLML